MKSLLGSFTETHRATSSRIGWGPAYFGVRNDTAAVFSLELMTLYYGTGAAYVALLFCVMSARRRRISTLLIGTVILVTAFTIANGLTDNRWYVAESVVRASYCNFDPSLTPPLEALVQVRLGLDHYNVTYRAESMRGVYYNNRFDLVYGGRQRVIEYEHKLRAIALGLPNPVVTVAEYMETRGDGFQWGVRFPAAGYFTRITLHFAAATLVACGIFLVLVPLYGVLLCSATGAVMLLASFVFWVLLPDVDKDVIHVEGLPLRFCLSTAFFLNSAVGASDVLLGALALALRRYGFAGETFLELNYDTPWDNRKIEQDSERRKEEAEYHANGFSLVQSRFRRSMHKIRAAIMFRGSQKKVGDSSAETDTIDEPEWGGLRLGERPHNELAVPEGQ